MKHRDEVLSKIEGVSICRSRIWDPAWSGQSSGRGHPTSCCCQELVPNFSEDTRAFWPKYAVMPSETDLEMLSLSFQPSFQDDCGCPPCVVAPSLSEQGKL